MVTTTGQLMWRNAETQWVMNYMMWVRTAKQIVWEYFWLREEVVYDDNEENVIDYINDFKDEKMLKFKKVWYVARLWELWVLEENFNGLFYWIIPNYARKEQPVDTWITKQAENKQGLSSDNGWVEVSNATTTEPDIWWDTRTPSKRKTNTKK